MIRINLIPPEFAQERAKKEQQLIVVAVGSLIVLVLIGFWFVKKTQAENLEEKIRKAENELKRFQAIEAQIERIERDKQSLLSKKSVINQLNRSRLIYPVFFEDLLPIIPSDIWLTSMEIKNAGGQMGISLNANGLSNFSLATWLTNIEQSQHFSTVNIGGIAYQPGSDELPPTLSFPITLSYKHKGPMPLEEYF